jgi:hypothetical protein
VAYITERPINCKKRNRPAFEAAAAAAAAPTDGDNHDDHDGDGGCNHRDNYYSIVKRIQSLKKVSMAIMRRKIIL